MSKTSLGLALVSFILTTTSAQAAVPLATKKALTLDAAKQIAAAAESEAKKNNWTMVIAIVDDGGQLVYLERLDGTQLGSIDVAQGKAKTALRFKRPSKAFEDVLAGGRTAILGLDVIPIEGGSPLVVDGQIIGAIGVSGGTSQQDGVVAKAGVDALTSTSTP
jgi:glc operon protein GlcG